MGAPSWWSPPSCRLAGEKSDRLLGRPPEAPRGQLSGSGGLLVPACEPHQLTGEFWELPCSGNLTKRAIESVWEPCVAVAAEGIRKTCLSVSGGLEVDL